MRLMTIDDMKPEDIQFTVTYNKDLNKEDGAN